MSEAERWNRGSEDVRLVSTSNTKVVLLSSTLKYYHSWSRRSFKLPQTEWPTLHKQAIPSASGFGISPCWFSLALHNLGHMEVNLELGARSNIHFGAFSCKSSRMVEVKLWESSTRQRLIGTECSHGVKSCGGLTRDTNALEVTLNLACLPICSRLKLHQTVALANSIDSQFLLCWSEALKLQAGLLRPNELVCSSGVEYPLPPWRNWIAQSLMDGCY